MRRLTILSVLAALTVSISYGQNQPYDLIATKAKVLFDANDFLQAGKEYSMAFQSLGGKGYPKDRYLAAMAWTLAEKKDSAFYNLFRLADKTTFLEVHTLQAEANFITLINDVRWK